MPYVAVNFVLDKPLPLNGSLTIPYPEGKNEGHFFSAVNHTISAGATFFRAPRDFVVITLPDRIQILWRIAQTVPAGTIINLQLEEPCGEFYRDMRMGIAVPGLVESRTYLINLSAPKLAYSDYYVAATNVPDPRSLPLLNNSVVTPRNVVIHSTADNTHCEFTIEGEDLYGRPMIEILNGPVVGQTVGNKAFARVNKISTSQQCKGEISVGIGNKVGLPVFLPGPGYVTSEIINGLRIYGGTITSGEKGYPGPRTGDVRGTYSPPENFPLNGKNTIHLLVSLTNPSNIGLPDYAG